MHHTLRRWILLGSAAAILPSALQAQSQPAAADPAHWAPEDALIYFGVADLDALVDGFQQCSGYQMLTRPDAKLAFAELGYVDKFVDGVRKQLSAALGLEPAELRNPFGGGLAMWVTPPEEARADEPTLAIVVGVKDRARMREYYDRVVTNIEKLATRREVESVDGVRIDSFITESTAEDDADADVDLGGGDTDLMRRLDRVLGEMFSSGALPPRLATCLTEDRLIVSNSAEAVRAVLARRDAAETLAGTEDYHTLLRTIEPSPAALRVLFNVPVIFRQLTRRHGDEFRDTLKLLGVEDLRSVVGAIEYSPKQLEGRLRLLAIFPEKRRGLLKVLSLPNTPTTESFGCAPDATVFMRMNIDWRSTVDQIEEMLEAANPMTAAAFRGFLDSCPLPSGEVLPLRTDVINQLQQTMLCSIDYRQPVSPESVEMVVRMGMNETEGVRAAIRAVGQMPPLMLEENDAAGVTTFESMLGISMAVTPRSVLIGSRCVLDQPNGGKSGVMPVGDFPPLQSAAEFLPKDCWAVFYCDVPRLYDVAVEVARQRISGARLSMRPISLVGFKIAESFSAAVDPEHVAEAQRLRGLFSPLIITFRDTQDGLMISQIQLARPK